MDRKNVLVSGLCLEGSPYKRIEIIWGLPLISGRFHGSPITSPSHGKLHLNSCVGTWIVKISNKWKSYDFRITLGKFPISPS